MMIKRPRIVSLELEDITASSDKSATERYIDRLENAVTRAHTSLSHGASAAEVMGILEEGMG